MDRKKPMRTALIIGIVTVTSLAMLLFWWSRASALPGSYYADGVWGNSTLHLYPNHTFEQSVSLISEYSGKEEESTSIRGEWKSLGRPYLDQRFEMTIFIGLGMAQQGKRYYQYDASYGPVALSGFGIETNISEDVVFRKQ